MQALRGRRRPPTLGDALGLAVVLVGFAIGARPLRDNSFLTHLATGRLILDGRGVPSADPYSFTAGGHDWTVQSWLVSVVMAGLEELWGPVGVRVLFGVLAAVLTGLIWRLSAPSQSVVARLALVVVAMTVGAGLWAERPYMVALVLFAVTVTLVEGKGRPWWLVPCFAIWVNVHGSFPVGLGFLALWALGRSIDQRSIGWAPWRPVLASLGGCAVGALSPWGPRLLVFPLTSLLSGGSLRNVVEWRAPTFDEGPQLAFLVLVGLLVLVAGSLSWSRRLPSAVFVVAGLLALRNVTFASVVAVWAVAPALPAVGALRSSTTGRPARVGMVVATVALVVVVPARLGERSFALQAYPSAPVALLDRQGVLPGGRVAAPEFAGNFLEILYGERAQVFFDDRFDMFPDHVADDYFALSAGGPRWAQILDRYGVDWVLWERSDPLASLLGASPGWRPVYQDPRWAMFCRRSATTCESV